MKISKMLLFSKSFSGSMSFSVSIEIIRVIQIKKKSLNFFFSCNMNSCSIQLNILTLYDICYVIFIAYMLDSALEPSYNLSKILLLLPQILKLIIDMVNDSTALLNVQLTPLFYFFRHHELNVIYKQTRLLLFS